MNEPSLSQMRDEIVFIGDGDLSDMPADRVRWFWRHQQSVLQRARQNQMTPATIPYLTPALLLTDGTALLSQIEALVPQSAVFIAIVLPLLPLIGHIPGVAAAAQKLCDRINAITGATAPPITS